MSPGARKFPDPVALASVCERPPSSLRWSCSSWPRLRRASAYDETQNWLNSYGRTVDHFTAPDRTIQNALISAERALFLAGELERIPARGAQQTGAWPWNGDVERGTYDRQGDWQGIKIEFEFPNETGQQLAATMWAPERRDARRARA